MPQPPAPFSPRERVGQLAQAVLGTKKGLFRPNKPISRRRRSPAAGASSSRFGVRILRQAGSPVLPGKEFLPAALPFLDVKHGLCRLRDRDVARKGGEATQRGADRDESPCRVRRRGVLAPRSIAGPASRSKVEGKAQGSVRGAHLPQDYPSGAQKGQFCRFKRAPPRYASAVPGGV